MRQMEKWVSKVIFFVGLMTAFAGASQEGCAETPSGPPLQALQEAGRDDAAYVIGPENFLLIRILGESDTQQTFRVDEAGFITHPLAGRVSLAGRTVSEAEILMENSLKGDYILHPNVTILVLEHSRFSILGEVRNPGQYEILGQLRLVEAISMAGGFTPVANEKKVKVLRKSNGAEIKLEENVKEIIQGRREDNTFIQAGDVVSVDKSFF